MNRDFQFKLDVQTFQEAESDNNKKTLNFTAITNVPITETSHNGKKVKLTVDLDSTTFSAKKLYKDHVLNVDNVVANITQYKLQDRSDGYKELVISADFFTDIEESNKIYQKFTNKMLDSVSIGIKNVEATLNNSGDELTYRKGDIYEVSVVFDGRDPNAKIRDHFAKDYESILQVSNSGKDDIMVDKADDVSVDSTAPQDDFAQKISDIKDQVDAKFSSMENILAKLTDKLDSLDKKNDLDTQASKVIDMGITNTPTDVPIQPFNINYGVDNDKVADIYKKRYGGTGADIFSHLFEGKLSLLNDDKLENFKNITYWPIGTTFRKKLDEKWARFYLDQREAMENGVSIRDVAMSKGISDIFDTTKTTDIEPTIPEPRDTTKLWDIFKKDSALLSHCTTIHRTTAKTYEFSVEDKPFTAKVVAEGGNTEWQKYEPQKVEIGMHTVRMGVEFTYEAQHTPDISLGQHIAQKMIKDMGNAIEEICFQSDTTNAITGIMKITASAPTKDNTFLKTPSLKAFVDIKNSLRKLNYNLDNAKVLMRATTANTLESTLRYAITSGSPENLHIIKSGRLWDTPVVLTDGLKDNEGLYGDPKNIFFVSYCLGMDLQFYVDQDRNTKISIFFPIDIKLADNKSVIILTAT